MEASAEDGRPVPTSEAEHGNADAPAAGIAGRIAMIAGEFKSRREFARLSAISPSTLNGYLAGGAVPLDKAEAMADVAGVNLKWLATGEGPMRVGNVPRYAHEAKAEDIARFQQGPGVAEPAPGRPNQRDLGLAWRVDPERLARAYEMALTGFAVAPGRRPDPMRLMQVTLLIYDDLTEAEEPPREA